MRRSTLEDKCRNIRKLSVFFRTSQIIIKSNDSVVSVLSAALAAGHNLKVATEQGKTKNRFAQNANLHRNPVQGKC